MRNHHTGRRAFATRLGICALGVVMLAGNGIAQADESNPFDVGDSSGKGPNLQIGGIAWQTNFETNPVEGQENIPFEFVAGFPTVLIEMLNPPVACEVWAAQYYNNLFEEGVLATTGLYYNRTLARARNPEDGGTGVGGSPQRTPHREAGPGTENTGGYSLAECPTRADAHGFVRQFGGGMDSKNQVVLHGYGENTAKVDPKAQVATSDGVADLSDISFEQGLSIKRLHSALKVNHVADKEPTFDWSLVLQGVSAGGTEIFGFGAKGLVMGGQNVTGAEAVDQFNEQSKAYEKQFEAAFVYGFQIVKPRSYVDAAFDKFNFISPVVEGSIAFPARKGTVGDFQAMRLGKNAYRGVFKTVKDDEYGGQENICGGTRSAC